MRGLVIKGRKLMGTIFNEPASENKNQKNQKRSHKYLLSRSFSTAQKKKYHRFLKRARARNGNIYK